MSAIDAQSFHEHWGITLVEVFDSFHRLERVKKLPIESYLVVECEVANQFFVPQENSAFIEDFWII
jgi:hypothetical protein